MKYAVSAVVRQYESPVIRWYVRARFMIINIDIFNALTHYLPSEGRLLTLGCGFGFFECVLGLLYPDLKIRGYDLNPKRIETARLTAKKLNLRSVEFVHGDVTQLDFDSGWDAVLMLDLLHHAGPQNKQHELLDKCASILNPNGIMIIKDIHKRNFLKLAFTWLLDKIMTKNEPLYYFDDSAMQEYLAMKNFWAICLDINDWLPYPHILYVAKRNAA